MHSGWVGWGVGANVRKRYATQRWFVFGLLKVSRVVQGWEGLSAQCLTSACHSQCHGTQ